MSFQHVNCMLAMIPTVLAFLNYIGQKLVVYYFNGHCLAVGGISSQIRYLGVHHNYPLHQRKRDASNI